MEEAFIGILLADSGLSALVSTRMSWGKRPQNQSDLPAVVLYRITGMRDYNLDGASGLVDSTVQCDCYAETYSSAKATARALMTAINAYDQTSSGVAFQRISIDSERDTNETESNGRYLFRCSVDLSIWHDE
tara:strand:+ start:305 stop:700 length:396 start_codon:yes stop_codon:yes gene_type:complete